MGSVLESHSHGCGPVVQTLWIWVLREWLCHMVAWQPQEKFKV